MSYIIVNAFFWRWYFSSDRPRSISVTGMPYPGRYGYAELGYHWLFILPGFFPFANSAEREYEKLKTGNKQLNIPTNEKIILAVAFLYAATAVSAQSERYMAAMKNNIAAIDTSFRNPANLLSLANNFRTLSPTPRKPMAPVLLRGLCQVNYAYMNRISRRSMPLPIKRPC